MMDQFAPVARPGRAGRKSRSKADDQDLYDEFAGDLDHAPIFEGREILPILVALSEGEKIERTAQLFGVTSTTMRTMVKRYRCFRQSAHLATMFVLLVAVSAIHARDWTAYRLLQQGYRGEHPRLGLHYRYVAKAEEDFKQTELAEAKLKRAGRSPRK